MGPASLIARGRRRHGAFDGLTSSIAIVWEMI